MVTTVHKKVKFLILIHVTLATTVKRVPTLLNLTQMMQLSLYWVVYALLGLIAHLLPLNLNPVQLVHTTVSLVCVVSLTVSAAHQATIVWGPT